MNTQTPDDLEFPQGGEEEGATRQPDELTALREEVEKYKDAALRARADLENYRKRMVREKEDSVRYANNALLERLLPVLDNYDFGLEAARGAGDAVVQGLEMVRKQLHDFLADQGVKPIDAEGQPFDPNIHEAMAHEESADVPEGYVIRQVRRGYMLKDRLLRPASVMVSKGAPGQ